MPPKRPAPRPAASPQPICSAAFVTTAQVMPVVSSALARSRATRKKGTARPSLRPLSTSSAWRTRSGTDGSVTTFWPRAASVDESMIASRKTEAIAIPGKTSRPTPAPASMVSGRPMSSRRLGQPSSWRRARRSSRAASLKSSSTRATSVTRCATALSTATSSRPSSFEPARKPARTKTIAEVTPRRSSGRENAPQTMMITVMVARPTIFLSLLEYPAHVRWLPVMLHARRGRRGYRPGRRSP